MAASLVYFVTDIETDGPDPGQHSMVSLASVACDEAGQRLGLFTCNLHPVAGHAADPGTMAWWATEPEAWAATMPHRLPPAQAIERFAGWVQGFGATAVFAAHPLMFDGAWTDWYLRRFAGTRLLHAPRTPPPLFAGGGLDMASFIMARSGLGYADCAAKRYPEAWFGGHRHSHIARDDAEGYAHLLGLMLRR